MERRVRLKSHARCEAGEKGSKQVKLWMSLTYRYALGLDLYDLSLDKHDLLFIFSGDADLGPAIERAQKRGSKVVAILSERQPAKLIKKLVDGVVPLEAVIDLIDANYIVHRSNTQFTKKGEMSYVKS